MCRKANGKLQMLVISLVHYGEISIRFIKSLLSEIANMCRIELVVTDGNPATPPPPARSPPPPTQSEPTQHIQPPIASNHIWAWFANLPIMKLWSFRDLKILTNVPGEAYLAKTSEFRFQSGHLFLSYVSDIFCSWKWLMVLDKRYIR